MASLLSILATLTVTPRMAMSVCRPVHHFGPDSTAIGCVAMQIKLVKHSGSPDNESS